MVALHFMHYNFVRIHTTLRVTPAMAAGVTHYLYLVIPLRFGMDAINCGPQKLWYRTVGLY